jgi:hypothetical protein
MGNRQSEEDEEYEVLYGDKQKRIKNVTEYEELTQIDRYETGATLPVKDHPDNFEIKRKRAKNILISKDPK